MEVNNLIIIFNLQDGSKNSVFTCQINDQDVKVNYGQTSQESLTHNNLFLFVYNLIMLKQQQQQPSKYKKYVQKLQDDMHKPQAPDNRKDYVRLSEKGRKQYMAFVKKSYEMMFFWISFGGLVGFLNYNLSSKINLIRSRASFKTIRLTLTLLPILIFPYHGIKFMIFYKRKGANQVSKDLLNTISQEEYQRLLQEESKVNSKII